MMRNQMLTILVTGLFLAAPVVALAAEARSFPSPDGKISASLTTNNGDRLSLSVLRDGKTVIGPSSLGIIVDGVDLGREVSLGASTSREINEEYRCRGVKSRAVSHCIAYEVAVTSKPAGTSWMLEVRVFDDGVAYRYRVPDAGERKVDGEATTWQLPRDAVVWMQHNTANYEGVYQQYSTSSMPAESEGKPVSIGCPVTVELPQGGYALITEACLYNYSGMTLKSVGDGQLQAIFQDDPQGWQCDGPIVSPWRVTLVTADLNALVNSDIVSSLGEPPDPRLFPEGVDTTWIRPGKGLITWAVFLNDGAQWHRQKWFVQHVRRDELRIPAGRWRLAHREVGFSPRRRGPVATTDGTLPICPSQKGGNPRLERISRRSRGRTRFDRSAVQTGVFPQMQSRGSSRREDRLLRFRTQGDCERL